MCTAGATRIDPETDPLGPLMISPNADDYCKALLLHSMVAGCMLVRDACAARCSSR